MGIILSMPKDLFSELSLTDKTLLTIFVLISIGEEVLWEAQPRRVYEALGGYDPEARQRHFEKNSLQRTLYRFLEKRILEKYTTNGRKKIRLSRKGLEFLFSHFPSFKKMNQKWDGRFRLVFYDLPNDRHNSRKRLREILKQLGFQPLQLSVWISPFRVKDELEEYLKKAGLSEYVRILEISMPLNEAREMIKKLWGKIPSFPSEIDQRKRLFKKNPKGFLQSLLTHPFLPKELTIN